ncbi:hypothetical protein A2U01_0072540, partial [Trifolium medium]|nr:hypothetical protein [Trifolium medium]
CEVYAAMHGNSDSPGGLSGQ